MGNNSDDGDNGDTDSRSFFYEENKFGIRHFQCILISICLAVTFALQANMSIAIVAMTDLSSNSTLGVYQWSEKAKALVLSSFFWGCLFTQIPAGKLAGRFGGKLVLFGSIFISSTFAVLTPICAHIGGCPLVCVVRFIQGLCQGAVFPSMQNLLLNWTPLQERGRLQTFCLCGSQLGTALIFCVSGEIVSSVLGWPGIFYISGASGILWAAVFDFFASDYPDDSILISEEEKMYIEMVPIPICDIDAYEEDNPKPPTPWKDIFTSVPFLCLLIAHCTNSWGFYTLFTQIPTYLRSFLGLGIQKNAILSSLPFWAMLLLSYFFLLLSEVLNKKQVSVSFNRKFFNTLSNWIPMFALIGLGFVIVNNETLVIVLLTLTVGMISASYVGFQLNHLDLSPNFAEALMNVTNCASNVTSAIAPLAVGFILSEEKNPYQWSIIFFVAAGFLFSGNFLFIIFGKFETQEWNEPKPLTDENGEPIPKRHNSVNVECVY